MTKQEEHVAVAPKQEDNSLAIVSMVLGVVSLTGPGLLLGIPAIITSAIALKKKLAGRGLAIAGLVTGIVSTVLSLCFILFIILLIALGAASGNGPYWDEQPQPDRYQHIQSQT